MPHVRIGVIWHTRTHAHTRCKKAFLKGLVVYNSLYLKNSYNGNSSRSSSIYRSLSFNSCIIVYCKDYHNSFSYSLLMDFWLPTSFLLLEIIILEYIYIYTYVLSISFYNIDAQEWDCWAELYMHLQFLIETMNCLFPFPPVTSESALVLLLSLLIIGAITLLFLLLWWVLSWQF